MRANILYAAVALGALAAGCRTAGSFDARQRATLAETVTARWSERSRLAATEMMDRYGPPDAIAEGALGWKDRSPWLRIVARDGGPDSLQETVSHRLPADGRRAVEELGFGVQISDDGRELSARSDDERLNFLALNLADEVARGDRTPRQAREFYDRTKELTAAGKSSLYTAGLLFPSDPIERSLDR